MWGSSSTTSRLPAKEDHRRPAPATNQCTVLQGSLDSAQVWVIICSRGIYGLQVDLDDTVAMKKRLSRVKNERKVNSSDMLTINESTPDINEKVRKSY